MNQSSSGSSSRRLRNDIPLVDIERQPGMTRSLTDSTPFEDPSSSTFLHDRTTKDGNYGSAVKEVSKRAQDTNAPLFIPAFIALRRTIVEHLTNSLQRVEQELSTNPSNSEERVKEAVTLLRQMDRVLESEIRQSRLEDPVYADSQGLSVLHFDIPDQTQSESQPWLMVAKKWGERSKNLVAPVNELDFANMFTIECREKLKKRAKFDDIRELHPWIVRSKVASEQQRWGLRYEPDGTVHYYTKIVYAWKATFIFAILVLVCFYGVGIIATNSTFSPTFQKYFFWVAIFWSLISSSLLSWLSVAFGASRRDAVGAFLTGIGMWLVVIQIGQTRLFTQVAGSKEQLGL